jgi:hypothetical protein
VIDVLAKDQPQMKGAVGDDGGAGTVSSSGDPADLSNRHDHNKGRARATCSLPPCCPVQYHRFRTLPTPWTTTGRVVLL